MVSKWPQNANTLWHQWGDSVKHMDMDSLWLLYRHSIWYSGAFYLRYNMGVKPPKASALKHLGMHMHHSYHKKTLAKKPFHHFFQCFPHLGQLWNKRVISIWLNPPPPPMGCVLSTLMLDWSIDSWHHITGYCRWGYKTALERFAFIFPTLFHQACIKPVLRALNRLA